MGKAKKDKPPKPTVFYIGICAVLLIAGYWLALALRAGFAGDGLPVKAAGALVDLYRYDAQGEALSQGVGVLTLDAGVIVTGSQMLDQTYYMYAAANSGELFAVNTVAAWDDGYDVAILRSSDLYLREDAALSPLPTANNKRTAAGDRFTLLCPDGGGTLEISYPQIEEKVAADKKWPLFRLSGETPEGFGVLLDKQGRVAGWLSPSLSQQEKAAIGVDIGIAKAMYAGRNCYEEMTLAEFQKRHSP
ncbi:MAG: hypothetical protein K6B40_02140 [Firmicutes bacterium]|nr:hypothetical protein [Bacillota bacterium]